MDQGVIRSLNVHYRGRVVQLLWGALDKGQPYRNIFILQAMKILVAYWEGVTQETVMNCFKEADILFEAQRSGIADFGDTLKDF